MSHLLIPLSEDSVALEMSLETVCFQYEALLCTNSTPFPFSVFLRAWLKEGTCTSALRKTLPNVSNTRAYLSTNASQL